VLTWRQLGLHAKPVVLVDAEGYWRPFLALLEHIEAEGFVGRDFREFFTVAGTPEAAVAALAERFAARV
jgi:predicted Rossmann-fold nucleotide-binding protein